ncbi:MAG: 5'-methylthioadenosine/S-adenosylhomocysteine nucleosidase [Selenomonadaceae bacterium]|nr:5'-methylthioadenosine/S-adenosylhomocysteine nucleosidase [Selenomonadaceae bacterium]
MNTFKKFAVLVAVIFFVTCNVANAENSISTTDAISQNFEGELDNYLNSLPHKTEAYKSKQRPILIEGAMNIEIEKFVYALKNPVVYKILNYVYIAGTYKNYPVVIARTEQGMENAAVSTALAIEHFKPVAVINQGTAGGHVAEAQILSVIIGDKYVNNSAYITENTPEGAGVKIVPQEMRGTFAYDKDEKTFKLYQEYFSDSKLLKIAVEVAAANKDFSTLKGTITSSDAWLNGIDHYKYLHKKYGSVAEEMETSAAAQICKSSGVPFIGIRAISDNIILSSNHYADAGNVSQDFVLLVVDKLIRNIKAGKF